MPKLKKITPGVAGRIKRLRNDKNLSMAEFGDIVGYSRPYIGMLESGLRRPSQALIIALAAKLEVDENWLRTGRKSKNSRKG